MSGLCCSRSRATCYFQTETIGEKGEKDRHSKCWPKIDTSLQEKRQGEEQYQRWYDQPKNVFAEYCNLFSITRIIVQPNHGKDRN